MRDDGGIRPLPRRVYTAERDRLASSGESPRPVVALATLLMLLGLVTATAE